MISIAGGEEGFNAGLCGAIGDTLGQEAFPHAGCVADNDNIFLLID